MGWLRLFNFVYLPSAVFDPLRSGAPSLGSPVCRRACGQNAG